MASSSVSVSPLLARPVSVSVSVSGWCSAPCPSQAKTKQKKRAVGVVWRLRASPPSSSSQEEEEAEDTSPGVRVALWVLVFYKSQISPFLPRSCRYVPTCSDYSMQAYQKYGFLRGSILTAYRLCRCNPFGGYGFDPPRWFGEDPPPPPPSHTDTDNI